jgi:hypothetical protein
VFSFVSAAMTKSDESKRTKKTALRQCFRMFLISAMVSVFAFIGLKIWEFTPPGAKGRCIENLRLIDESKKKWFSEVFLQVNPRDIIPIPTWKEVIGPDRLLKRMPKCPLGGTYTLGGMENKPQCSIPGHTLD